MSGYQCGQKWVKKSRSDLTADETDQKSPVCKCQKFNLQHIAVSSIYLCFDVGMERGFHKAVSVISISIGGLRFQVSHPVRVPLSISDSSSVLLKESPRPKNCNLILCVVNTLLLFQ